MTLRELAANIRAAERADLDQRIGRAERDETEAEKSLCRFCGKRWFTYPLAGKSVPATYLPEAGCVAHLVCWSRKEQR